MNITDENSKMSPKKKMALGKGIASLLQTNSTEMLLTGTFDAPRQSHGVSSPAVNSDSTVTQATPMLVDVNKIKAGEYQPRKIFKDKEIQELSLSIKENGIIQPLIVIERAGQLELIAGERRLRAAKLAGLTHVPVVYKRATDRECLIMSVIENVQRSDLNCVEEALAYYQLMDSFKLTQDEVAIKIGKDRSTIANFLRILKLPRAVVSMLQKELLSFGHAKVLAVEKDHDRAVRLANLAVAENLTVRELEQEIKKTTKKDYKNEEDLTETADDKLEIIKEKLEKMTGFHFKLSAKKNGSGSIMIKFNNEAEFNDIYEYLLQK